MIYKLVPHLTNYLWGGKRLKEYGKKVKDDVVAEAWEVSFHEAGLSLIGSGRNKGKSLKEVLSNKDLGKKTLEYPFFPVLNKFIDACDNLSLQVHPSDEYALKYENSFGKTEMWYVVDAEPGSCLYVGFNKDLTDEEISERISDNSIVEVMNKIEIKPGDCYFIPSGTIHAIGKGCLIYEIQENSNLTYRVYDYDRVGKDGKKRELHVEKALKVLNKNKYVPTNLTGNNLMNCKYFNVNKLVNPKEVSSQKDSFLAVTVIEGKGKISNLNVKKGDTLFVTAHSKYKVVGNLTLITTEI